MATIPRQQVCAALDNRGTLLAEANSGCPQKGFERMARRRYQAPQPFKRGDWWCLLTWSDDFTQGQCKRKRQWHKLGRADLGIREVQKLADEILHPINAGLQTIGSATNFAHFVNTTYIPLELPLLATSTQDRYSGVIKNYLLPQFGKASLRELTPATLQAYFSGMANSKLSAESRDKIRDVLASILREAKTKYGLLNANPMENVKLPPRRRGKRHQKPYITRQQFDQLVLLIPEPYASMVFVAVLTGLRVSELIGLRWEDIHLDSLTVDERFCRGDWGCPKSDASNATVPVNLAVVERIQQLKDMKVVLPWGGHGAKRTINAVRSTAPDALVFQSLKKGAPMRDNNILTRHIKPAARKLGLDFVNWQVLRRSFATWLKIAGVDVKDAQALMRHSRASTTMDVYQQFVPESQRRAVEKLSSLVQ